MTSYIRAGFIAQLSGRVLIMRIRSGLRMRSSVLLDDAGLVSKDRQIQSILNVKLAINRTKMMPHRRFTKSQATGNTFVC